MKKLYSILLTALAAIAFAPGASAQWTIDDFIKGKYGSSAELVFPHDNGVQVSEEKSFAYSKNISQPFSDGNYWIKLESFATGTGTVVDRPSDIVLVLDVSGSMRYNYGNSTGTYPYGTSQASSAGFSYKNLGTNTANNYGTVFSASKFKHTDGNLYAVEREKVGNKYFLYYKVGDVQYFLNGLEVTTDRPAGVSSDGDPIWWGRLWTDKRKSRLDELKEAVAGFIAIIEDNDVNTVDAEGNPTPRVDEQGQPKRLGNRISIVKFAGNAYYNSTTPHTGEGNHFGIGTSNTTNYTEVVKTLTPLDGPGKQSLLDAVDELVEAGCTAADKGMTLANSVLATIDQDRDCNKTVVFFTDGEPNHNDGFEEAVANTAVQEAEKAKNAGAKVFAVGVFDTEKDNVKKYMNRVSSNYTGCTTYTNGTAINPPSKRIYYQNAASGNLKEVFADIAKQSGGSSSTLSAATSNVDVVSNSFILPEGTNSTNIGERVKVFTAPLTSIDANGNYVFGAETLAGHATDTYQIYDEDGNVTGTYKVDEVPNPNGTTPATLPIKVDLLGTNGIKVTNFDYGNNWCGPIKNQAHQVTGYHGHKIIILIPIKMNPDAVGGPNVATNDEGSGIFNKNDQSTPFISFVSPTVSLPVNIYIEKSGLEGVESAKFTIERAPIPQTENWTVNDIPEGDWEYVSTVFVTNSENAKHNPETNNPWVKVRGLPANMVIDGVQRDLIYRITEEKWSWSYTGNTPPQFTDTNHIENPFLFSNSKIERIDFLLRHAESKVTNVFKAGVQNTVTDDSKSNTD